jgi:tripartite-type tricarboxylate transporter receptor subunit TctC
MKYSKLLFVFSILLGVALGAFAEKFPVKAVKIVVPYTQGSATDVIARLVGDKLAQRWNQPVEIENRPGAGGSVGAGVVAKSSPDGYTLLVHSSSYAVTLATYAKPPYSMQDFFDIAPLGEQPYTLVVGPTANVKSVSDLIAAAKAKPGQIKFGSAGTGSSTHLVAERFKSVAAIDVVHVPYKGGPEANKATTNGVVTYWFPPTAIAIKGIKSGKLIGLGVTSAKRSVLLPEVPTLNESGLADFKVNVWWGIWAPVGMPNSVKGKLVKDVTEALDSPDLRAKLTDKGFESMNMQPQEFRKLVEKEVKSAANILKTAGIKPK